MQTPIVVCVCGFEGSGKNAVSSILERRFGFVSCAFADNLKKAVAVIFGWEYEMLLGTTEESRVWREQVDTYWSNELSIPGLTPRKVLQIIGTDAMRLHFHDDIWIKSLKKKVTGILNAGYNVVITDCRFPNEAKLAKEMGGKVILVIRDAASPKWLNLYRNMDREGLSNEEFCAKLYSVHDIHPAETSMIDYEDYDHIIYNDTTLKDLEASVVQFYDEIAS